MWVKSKNTTSCMQQNASPDKDVAISCSSRFVARLYHQKSFASSHHNINKLRVKLATGRDASLVRLPPSEAALRQHIVRASFQTKVWYASCLAKPPLPSPMEYGWRTVNTLTKKNILDIFYFFFFIHFHYMKMHRL
jgi:hypothetical protein